MQEAKLFTELHYGEGKTPAGLRDGTQLKTFHYFPGNTFCFVGIDAKGMPHSWKNTGRKNGLKHNMWSDLVIMQEVSDIKTRFIALSGEGKTYSAADMVSIQAVVQKWSNYSIWEVHFDLKTGRAAGKKHEI